MYSLESGRQMYSIQNYNGNIRHKTNDIHGMNGPCDIARVFAQIRAEFDFLALEAHWEHCFVEEILGHGPERREKGFMHGLMFNEFTNAHTRSI